MNLTNLFLTDTLGEDSFHRLMSLKHAQFFILSHVLIWLGLIILILNLVVGVLCVIIYRQTQKTNNKPAFIFIGALAIIDSVIGSYILVQSIRFGQVSTEQTEIIYQRLNPDDCKYGYMFGNFTQWSSQFILLALTVDRYVFIKKPLHYPLIMTKTKIWLLVLFSFLAAICIGIIQHFTFALPPEDANGQICVWHHSWPAWFQISYALIYFTLLAIVILIYAEILYKFRQSRKRLEAMQKSMEEDDYTKSHLSFHQNTLMFKKKVKPEVPGVSDSKIQTLQMKCFENGEERTEMNHQRKRRRSSVARMMTALVSHVRTTRYILAIVLTFAVTWTPIMIHLVMESITHLVEKDSILAFTNSTIDSRLIYRCLSTALQNKECNMEIQIGNDQQNQVEESIHRFFHNEETSTIGFLLAAFLSHFHSLLNPILYAFWYSDFRTYLVQIPQWFKQRGKKPDNKMEKYKLPEIMKVQ